MAVFFTGGHIHDHHQIQPAVHIGRVGDLLYKPMTSKGYAEKHGLPLTFEELAEHPFIAHESYFDFAPGEPWECLGRIVSLGLV